MSEVQFIEAQITHLNAIVELLYDDALGKKREALSSSLPESYFNAFQEILADPNATIIVGICDNKVIACAQLNFLRYLTYQGGIRGQIEGVRVHQSYRGKGIGHQLFKALIALSKDKGCHMVQLTTNKERKKAYAFYEKLGFSPTHEGFKLLCYKALD